MVVFKINFIYFLNYVRRLLGFKCSNIACWDCKYYDEIKKESFEGNSYWLSVCTFQKKYIMDPVDGRKQIIKYKNCIWKNKYNNCKDYSEKEVK